MPHLISRLTEASRIKTTVVHRRVAHSLPTSVSQLVVFCRWALHYIQDNGTPMGTRSQVTEISCLVS